MNKLLAAGAGALLLTACADAYGPAYTYGAQGGTYIEGCGPVAATVHAPAPVMDPCAGGTVYPVSSSGMHEYPIGDAHPMPHHGGPVEPAAHAYGTHAVPPHATGLRGTAPVRQSYFYGELGGTAYEVDDSIYGVQGRLGWHSASGFGAEVEGSVGVSDEDMVVLVDVIDPVTGIATPTNVDVSIGVENQVAGFARYALPLGAKTNLLARAGYHRTEFEMDMGAFGEEDVTEDGFAYGAGVEFAVSPRGALRLDYTRYDTDNGTLDSASVGYQVRF